jgi:mannose-6-phosphate isomerase-like protein (cupin superfamily)
MSGMLTAERADAATASMTAFASQLLPAEPSVTAPDGSAVRVLLGLAGGGMALFELAPGQVARAVEHRSVEEIWFVLAGRGQMWRRQDGREETVTLEPGLCLTIPRGTHFQFRAAAGEAVSAVAITMPPWPGEGEALLVDGPWEPTR